MSGENILIHIPRYKVPPQIIFDVVLKASEGVEEESCPELIRLQQLVNDQLATDSLPISEIIGDNCLVISVKDIELPWALQCITEYLWESSSLVILENAHLVYCFGDETTHFLTRISYYGNTFVLPFASISSIPQWIHGIAQRARSNSSLSDDDRNQDFLVVRQVNVGETFMQVVFDPTAQCYLIEMRLGDASRHYYRAEQDSQVVINYFVRWLAGEVNSDDGWQRVDPLSLA